MKLDYWHDFSIMILLIIVGGILGIFLRTINGSEKTENFKQYNSFLAPERHGYSFRITRAELKKDPK